MNHFPRVIPVLLIEDGYLVKPTKFGKRAYVGDPINAVRIFNEKQVDELFILDISASREGRAIDFGAVRQIATEAFMPVAYGGGVATVEDAKRLLGAGVEKVSINSAFHDDPTLVTRVASFAGSQAVVVSLDVKRDWRGRDRVYARGGRRRSLIGPEEWAKRAVDSGAGELLVQSIDREGTGSGYDTSLVERVSRAVDVPVVALGGASSLDDMRMALAAGASAVAAGRMFVLSGPHKAVLITYPTPAEVASLAVGPTESTS